MYVRMHVCELEFVDQHKLNTGTEYILYAEGFALVHYIL